MITKKEAKELWKEASARGIPMSVIKRTWGLIGLNLTDLPMKRLKDVRQWIEGYKA